MKTKAKFLSLIAGCTLAFNTAQALAGEEITFKAVGKVMESPSDHTTKHKHELQFVRLNDGEVFNIVDSPGLLEEHCQSEKNPVVEVEGYRTSKFLFWGGNLVVTTFKVHEDIEVSRMAHVKPESISRPTRDSLRNPRL